MSCTDSLTVAHAPRASHPPSPTRTNKHCSDRECAMITPCKSGTEYEANPPTATRYSSIKLIIKHQFRSPLSQPSRPACSNRDCKTPTECKVDEFVCFGNRGTMPCSLSAPACRLSLVAPLSSADNARLFKSLLRSKRRRQPPPIASVPTSR